MARLLGLLQEFLVNVAKLLDPAETQQPILPTLELRMQQTAIGHLYQPPSLCSQLFEVLFAKAPTPVRHVHLQQQQHKASS